MVRGITMQRGAGVGELSVGKTLEQVGPLLRKSEGLLHRACMTVANALTQPVQHEDQWLTDACQAILMLPDTDVLAQCMVLEIVAMKPGIKTHRAALANARERNVAEALLAEANEGLPKDDSAPRRLPVAPQSASRLQLLPDNQWNGSPLRAMRESIGLYEFARVVVPMQTADGPRVFLMQIDGLAPTWSPDDEFLSAFGAVAGLICRGYCTTFVRRTIARRSLLEKLSATQQQIAPLLAEGLSETEIARRLERSRHTIHDHAKAIYRAWNVNSRAELREVWAQGRLSGEIADTNTFTF